MNTQLDQAGAMSSSEVHRCREALLLWMRWHDAQQRVSQAMFQAGEEQARVELLLDQLEDLRRRAVDASREILDAPETTGVG